MERFLSDPDLRAPSSAIRRRRSLQSFAEWLRRSFGKGKEQREVSHESYTALIQSLTTLIQENSPRRTVLHNVQIGSDNEMVVKEGANEDVMNAIQQLLDDNKSVREEMGKERAGLEMKLSHTEMLLGEMKEKLSYCKRMITQVDAKEDDADQKLVTLTEMVKSLTVERSDEEVMLDLIKDLTRPEVETSKGETESGETEYVQLPFKAQQGIRRIVGRFGKLCKWQSLARGLGLDPTSMSSCSTDPDQLDTGSCTRVLQHWIRLSPGESCHVIGKKLVDSLQALEEDMLEDLKEKYNPVTTTASKHQDFVEAVSTVTSTVPKHQNNAGAVCMLSPESTNDALTQHTEDHFTNTTGTTGETTRQLSKGDITNRNNEGLVQQTTADIASTTGETVRQLSEDSRRGKAHTALILEKLTEIATTLRDVHRAVMGGAGSEAINRPLPSPVTQVTRLYTDEEFF